MKTKPGTACAGAQQLCTIKTHIITDTSSYFYHIYVSLDTMLRQTSFLHITGTL